MLECPAEPERLRNECRALASEHALGALPEVTSRVAAMAWRAWRSELAPTGATAGTVRELAEGHRREIWLWVLGDRTWAQMMEALAGRLRRRAQASR